MTASGLRASTWWQRVSVSRMLEICMSGSKRGSGGGLTVAPYSTVIRDVKGSSDVALHGGVVLIERAPLSCDGVSVNS